MRQKTDKYAYRVTWSEEDSEYVGLCAEFPGLSWLAKSPEAALKGVRLVVRRALADMSRSHQPVPEPIAAKACDSGSGGRGKPSSTGMRKARLLKPQD